MTRRLDLNEQDVSLCMLPLSHVFERAWSYYVLYCGAENVYIRDPQKVMDVIGEVKPTVMCAAPRLYEKAYRHDPGQGRPGSARLRRALFGWATGWANRWSPPARRASPPLPCSMASSGLPSAWCFANCAPFRRSHPLPAGGGRPSRGRGESLLQAMGLNLVRLRHDRDHRHRLLL